MVMFATPVQVPILVGELLVPMIIPMLKDLGVEQEVAATASTNQARVSPLMLIRFSNTALLTIQTIYRNIHTMFHVKLLMPHCSMRRKRQGV